MTTESNSTLFIRSVNESYTLDDIWDRIEYFELGQIRKIVLLPVSKMVIYGPNTRNVIVYFDFWYEHKESQYKLSLLLQGKPIHIYYNMISYWTVVAYEANHKKIAKIRKQKVKTDTHTSVTHTSVTQSLVLYNPDTDVDESDDESPEDMYDDICEDSSYIPQNNTQCNPTVDEIASMITSIESEVVSQSEVVLVDESNQDQDNEPIEETLSEQSDKPELEELPLPPSKQSRYLDPDCPGIVNTWIDYGNAILPKPKNRIKRKLVIVTPTIA